MLMNMNVHNYQSISRSDDIEESGQNEIVSSMQEPIRESESPLRNNNTGPRESAKVPITGHKSSTCGCCHYGVRFDVFLLIAIYLAALIVGIPAYLTLHQGVASLSAEVAALRAGFDSLQIGYSELKWNLDRSESLREAFANSTTFSTLMLREDLTRNVNAINSELVKLSNHSNEEVIEKLSLTEAQLSQKLYSTTVDVSSRVSGVLTNVSRMLDSTQAALQQTRDDVQQRLDSSIVNMKTIVHRASNEFDLVRSNLTTQMTAMSTTLATTTSDLNKAVASAQDKISAEVDSVKDTIEKYVAVTNQQFAAENDFVKYQLAGTFTLLGCLISFWHLTSHRRHFYKPDVQRRVMAVLWMVPIYGITSWLSLVLPQFERAFGAVRDMYEAYAIYTFIALLIAVLEDGAGLSKLIEKLAVHVIEERTLALEATTAGRRRPKAHMEPPFPCCYIPHRASSVAATWLFQCRMLALQFVFMKPILTLLPFVLEVCGYHYYSDRNMPFGGVPGRNINWSSVRLYVLVLQNLSVALAFYGLLSFYHGTEKDLAWCEPWPKFLCIKGVVFMTFWQGIAIQVMSSTGMLDEKATSQIQNLLICVEMLLASIAHYYIFPYHEWHDDYKREREKKQGGLHFRDTLAFQDFVSDLRLMGTKWEPNPGPGDMITPAIDPTSGKHTGILSRSGSGAGGVKAHVNVGLLERQQQRESDSALSDLEAPVPAPVVPIVPIAPIGTEITIAATADEVIALRKGTSFIDTGMSTATRDIAGISSPVENEYIFSNLAGGAKGKNDSGGKGEGRFVQTSDSLLSPFPFNNISRAAVVTSDIDVCIKSENRDLWHDEDLDQADMFLTPEERSDSGHDDDKESDLGGEKSTMTANRNSSSGDGDYGRIPQEQRDTDRSIDSSPFVRGFYGASAVNTDVHAGGTWRDTRDTDALAGGLMQSGVLESPTPESDESVWRAALSPQSRHTNLDSMATAEASISRSVGGGSGQGEDSSPMWIYNPALGRTLDQHHLNADPPAASHGPSHYPLPPMQDVHGSIEIFPTDEDDDKDPTVMSI